VVGGTEVPLVGTGSAGAVGVVAGAETLAGIFNFCPTLMLSVFKLFAARNALMLTPCCVAIFVRLSPDFTV